MAIGHSGLTGESSDPFTHTSPRSVILMVSQPGRPADDIEQFGAVPDAKRALTGDGPCDAFNAAGALVPKHVANLTAIIEKYEAEQARVSAAFPQSHDDGGALTKFQGFFTDVVVGDWNHLDVNGLARLAGTAWPIVEKLLKLS